MVKIESLSEKSEPAEQNHENFDREKATSRGWLSETGFSTGSLCCKRMIKRISIEDPIEDHSTMAIEVVIELDDGSKRWCYFFTPTGLSNCGDFVEGTQVRLHYGATHMFVVSDISKEIIETTLIQIEQHGELEQCTLPVV